MLSLVFLLPSLVFPLLIYSTLFYSIPSLGCSVLFSILFFFLYSLHSILFSILFVYSAMLYDIAWASVGIA